MYPQLDEILIGTIKRIFDYGAICYLEEYDVEGFIHLSEVSKGWVKNIRSFLKEGQRVVVKVVRVIPEKGIVDLSIKKVSDFEKRKKLMNYSRNKKGEKLLEKIFKDKEELEKIKNEIKEKYEDLLSVFEDALRGKKLKLPEEISKKIYEVAKENIKVKEKEISIVLEIVCYESNGINVIKEILSSFGEEVIYLGAPKYLIKIRADDFKKCEKKIKEIEEKMEKVKSPAIYYSIKRMGE